MSGDNIIGREYESDYVTFTSHDKGGVTAACVGMAQATEKLSHLNKYN